MHLLNLIRSGRPNLFDTITAPITLANDDYLADYLTGFKQGAHIIKCEARLEVEIAILESCGIDSAQAAGRRGAILAAFGLYDPLPELAEGLGLV